jgi:hypothetical protein
MHYASEAQFVFLLSLLIFRSGIAFTVFQTVADG